MRDEAEKAELIQSIQAYYIPASLFLATLIMSAGIFLLYNGYTLGYLLGGLGFTIMVSAFVIFVRFQNKLRVGGQIARKQDGYVMPEGESSPEREKTHAAS
jgi:hypothetical protein